MHFAIDDATRLAYVEVLADEQRATTIGFHTRAVGWFSEQGMHCCRVLSDNGTAYRSVDCRKACEALGLKPTRTKSYTLQANGKAERHQNTPGGVGVSDRLPNVGGKGTSGCPVIWPTTMASDATWLSVASDPSSVSCDCWLQNDLVRKHI